MRVITYILLLLSLLGRSQTPEVLVEKYYIADQSDATDTDGGGVEVGATTYRIFIALPPSSRLIGIYGDTLHPFEISSTSSFFNNIEGGTFGYQIPKVAYESNTVALDSYLTLGQMGYQGASRYFGIPKYRDINGSFIGGINNDGGSAQIAGGLLTNDSLEMGLPLTEADGADTSTMSISNWFNYGVVDFLTGEDTTLFSYGSSLNSFRSENFILSNSGVLSTRLDTNFILIAQLTTSGDLQFKLNIAVQEWLDSSFVTRYYVSTNQIQSDQEIFIPGLNYPPQCGCMDPDYLEYSSDFVCAELGACQTPIILGCTDHLACNFNPEANVNLDDLCCYPGDCFGRDIEEVCPGLKGNSFDFTVFPNPMEERTSIQVLSGVHTNLKIEVIDQNGIVRYQEQVLNAPLNFTLELNANQVPAGVYFIRVTTDFDQQHKILVRL